MDRAFVVLLVEDSPGDRRLTAELLSETGLTITLCEVETGEAALAYLHQEGEYAGMPRPDLVLLDLGLPGMDGREVLARIRQDEALRSIPVVVQTASDDDRTLTELLALGAHDFVTKPLAPERFLGLVEYVTEFA
jgi:CheY-like chemotaxis protein